MIDLQKECYTVSDLVEIVRLLRAPGGCQWDREQTHLSTRRNFLEEAYEAADAIERESPEDLKEELGDVLLQVVSHSVMEEEAGRYGLDEVADGVCRKLIYRHPHVFGTTVVHSTEEILTNWEELKKAEKGQDSQADTLDAVAHSLPALWRAEKVQAKAAKSGFDWPDLSGAMEKLEEEAGEFSQAVQTGDGVEEELGDLLFAAVKAGRFLNLDPEAALHGACDKFCARFRRMEETVLERGQTLDQCSLEELDAVWKEVKHPGS